jgi:hypothetical protein
MEIVLFGFALAFLAVLGAHAPLLGRAPRHSRRLKESAVCYSLVSVGIFCLYVLGLLDHQPPLFSAYMGFLFVVMTAVIPGQTFALALGWRWRKDERLEPC